MFEDLLTLSAVYAAGAMLIASPCVLPLLQIVTLSTGHKSRYAPLLLFLGVIVTFMTLSLVAFSVTSIATWGRMLGSCLLLVFGSMILANAFEVPALQQSLGRVATAVNTWLESSSASPFFVGLALGGLWMPCLGPMSLGMITLLAHGQTQVLPSLIAFVAGLASPVLLYAYGLRLWFAHSRWFRLSHKTMEYALGGYCVFLGLFTLTESDLLFSGVLLNTLPVGFWDWVYRFDQIALSQGI